MSTIAKTLLHWLFKGRWVVRQCGWPYRTGYATYCPRRHMILDTGLTYEQAKAAAAELNRTFQ